MRNGSFLSPLAEYLPPEARRARFQLISHAQPGAPVRGCVLHFAATADQTFVLRRRLLAEPLLRRGIVSLLLMPAYYGQRRPAGQALHLTRTLHDFCLLTHSMIAEGYSLMDWLPAHLTGSSAPRVPGETAVWRAHSTRASCQGRAASSRARAWA